MTKNFTCEFPYSMLNMTMEGGYQTCSWSKVYPKYHNSSPNSFFNSSLLKNIRSDIIGASLNYFDINQITKIYKKSIVLNKYINKEIGINIVSSYKRASNILSHELNNKELEISNSIDPVLFKSEYEKNLYKKIHVLKKYFASINRDENYELTLENLAESKKVIFEFFDNVKVNDEDKTIKKNRLELLNLFCRTFDNYILFSSIESL